MTLSLPDWPWLPIRAQAERVGVHVWMVGGAVRDLLLGRPVHDWDYVVEREALALARAVADALGGAYFALDDVRGIGRVLLPPAAGVRVVLDFADLRGATLEDDLRARDFTINALAVGMGGGLVDPTGGQADLEARLIRVPDPRAFERDPVRLLRAVRLAAELRFTIEEVTEGLLRHNAPRLVLASPERVRDELLRLLALDGAAEPLARLAEFDLLASVLPEVADTRGVGQSLPHRFDVWQHTLRVVEALEGVLAACTGRGEAGPSPHVAAPAAALEALEQALGPYAPQLEAHLAQPTSQAGTRRAVLLRLSALLHDIGKPLTRSEGADRRVHFYGHEEIGAEQAELRMQELRFTREEAARVATVVGGHMRLSHLAEAGAVTARAVYRFFRALGDAGVEAVLLALADHLATWGPDLQPERWARRLRAAETLLGDYFTRRERTVAPQPLLRGRDLIRELGLAPGPRLGRVLDELLEAQAAGEIETREQALALAARLALDNPGEPG